MENEIQPIPQKFVDKETELINTQNLLKSYQYLEKKLGQNSSLSDDLPASYNDYDLGDFEADEQINKMLFENNFSNQQAKLFYQTLNSNVGSKLESAKNQLNQENDLQNLSKHFGGEDNWIKIAQDIESFASTQLTKPLYETLSSSYDGILLLYEMMQNKEPKLLGNDSQSSSSLTISELKKMMENPKYWRDNDEQFCKKVQQGFEKLYR